MPAMVLEAATALVGASRPVILCGGGPVIARAREELPALGERMGALVATSISGKGSIPDDHPLALGVVGSTAAPTRPAPCCSDADLILLIGCRAGSVTTESWRDPAEGQRIIHIDADPAVIGANYPTEIALVGDAKLALAALLAAVDGELGDEKRSGAAAKASVAKASRRSSPASRRWPHRTTARSSPSGSSANCRACFPRMRWSSPIPARPARISRPITSSRSTGPTYLEPRPWCARLFASGMLGAYYARPDAKCVAVMGDGSFGFNAGEMETLTRIGAPVTLIVLSNSSFGWIKAGQASGFGERFYSVDFNRTDHARVAEAFGLKAWRVEDPARSRGALKAALEHGGPTLVDIIVQPLHEAAAPVTEWIA